MISADEATLADLANQPLWVAWRTPSKVPINPATGREAKTNNPATWGTRAVAEAARRARGLAGVGINLGDLGDGMALAGIDLDTCRDPKIGALADWAAEIVARFDSYAEVSPSATGAKVFFLLRAEDRAVLLPEFRDDRGDAEGRKWSAKSGGDHPPGIELYLGRRYFTVTEQRLPGAPEALRVVDADTVRWLVREAGPAQAARWAAANGQDGEQAAAPRDNSRSAVAFRKGAALVRGGATYDEMCAALRADPETAEWYREKGEAHGGRELRRIWEKFHVNKPPLRVVSGDLPATASELRDRLAATDRIFDRGSLPVKVVPPNGGLPSIARLTVNSVVTEAHRLTQPVAWSDRKNQWVPVTLPERVAKLYLDMVGEWGLSALDGVSTTPLLLSDGTIRTAEGYDPASRLWWCAVPPLSVPDKPSGAEAEAALQLLRWWFRTFPAGDAETVPDAALGVEVTDLDRPPGGDESAILAGLLTAVCRPSLWLAPGLLVTAPEISGAGTGKGLLIRAICAVAFGTRPRSFTAGHDGQELDKRIAAELIEAAPTMFLDNVNAAVLRSNTLASVMTERPARVRILGETRMAPLNSAAWVAVAGNGLTVSEDLARRFLTCILDARTEDPESRPFKPGFLEEVEARRPELLSAALTIWRWGRHSVLPRGRPLGSFETWCEWVRDPLLALGCVDPVERLDEVKAHDPRRQRIEELFAAWSLYHEERPVRVADLNENVVAMLDPQGRGRQYLAARLNRLTGTRAAGFVLTRQEAAGRWGAATYAVKPTIPEGMPEQPPVSP